MLTTQERVRWRAERNMSGLVVSRKDRPIALVTFMRERSTPVEHHSAAILRLPDPCAPDGFEKAREAAIFAIQVARGKPNERLGNELACDLRFYLGMAFSVAFPNITMRELALACGVSIPDSAEFTVLVDICRSSDCRWWKPEIVEVAARAIRRATP